MKAFASIGQIVLLAFCFSSFAVSQESKFTNGLTAYLKKLGGESSTGAAILVSKEGRIVFEGGFGYADLEKKVPITSETVFRIGSITKQFTAAAILRLVEQEKVKLDDKLTKFFPDYPNGSDVTITQLLNHTSGLHSYTEKPDFYESVMQPVEPAKLIEWFKNDPPDFVPGAGFHYNNSGYFLLGEIIAKVSERSLSDYLHESFFIPLKMNNSGVFVNASPPQSMATGYSFSEGKFNVALDWDMSRAGGAGAMYSTVGDLYRWNEALFGGQVLNATSFKAATTAVKLPAHVDGMNYGYGLAMYEVKRLPAIGHSGGLHGWSSNLVRLPQQQCTIVVLENALPGPPEHAPQSLSQLMVEKLFAEEIKKLPPIVEDTTIDPKTFVAYVGRFDYQGAAIMTVTSDEKGLFAQLTSQPKYQIIPRAKDEFFWKETDASVTFLRDEKGDVTAARHSQSGISFTAPRLPEEAVKLTALQLDGLVGSYQYGPGAVLVVSREGTQLYGQITGQPKLPIFPKAEGEFEWRVVKAHVEFKKGEDGNVSKVIHHQNGTTFEAPKVK